MNEHLGEERLNGFVDGLLSAVERDAAEQHLAGCAECRRDVERLRALLASAAALPKSIEPARDLWPDIAPRLGRHGVPRWVGVAAAVVLAAAALLLFAARGKAGAGWTIAGGAAGGLLRPGQVLQTDAQSTVQLNVGSIGTVRVQPSSRVRLLSASRTEQRLALDHGTIEARILAPARVFLVETPAALAVDLGCAYVLTTDSTGNGLLRVTSGWVELTNGTRLTIVPRDAEAAIRAGRGPEIGRAHV